jgi:hypothetical protein
MCYRRRVDRDDLAGPASRRYAGEYHVLYDQLAATLKTEKQRHLLLELDTAEACWRTELAEEAYYCGAQDILVLLHAGRILTRGMAADE